ncbi:MAG: hypothetical protein ACRCXZ_02195 [Patescibacteria group bacterium]
MLKVIYVFLAALVTIYVLKFNTSHFFVDSQASELISFSTISSYAPFVSSSVKSQFTFYSALLVAIIIYLIEFDKRRN